MNLEVYGIKEDILQYERIEMMDKASYEKVNTVQALHANIIYLNEEMLANSEQVMKHQHIPAHWHRSIECSLVCKGDVALWINNHKEIIQEGEFIFVNSGQILKIARANSEHVEVLLVILPYEILKKDIPDIDTILFDIHKDIPQKQRIKEIYKAFIEHAKNPKQYEELMINAYVYELLYVLSLYFQVDEHKDNGIAKKQQHRILDYIEDNYKEELSLSSLANICHMSEEHFSRTFHENFGMNFKTYLTNYRLYCSHSDIMESDKSIQHVALDNGFSSVKSFIYAFKEGYGMTPYQYRKQHGISKKGNFSIK